MRFALLCLLLTGCTDRSLRTPSDGGHPQVGCDGDAPYCVDFCGSDWLQAEATCVDDDWHCPDGLQRDDECPPSTCWGPPTSGEVCTDLGWACQPGDEEYAACPSFMCPECTGFDGPVTRAGCTCVCDGQNVVCAPATGSGRVFRVTSSAGVAGTGPAIEVHGSGLVRGWKVTMDASSTDPDVVTTVAPGAVDDLFARWNAADTTALPHPANGFSECYAVIEVQICDDCVPTHVSYQRASQVLPELDVVWAWFDANAELAALSPRSYCSF